MLRMPIRQSRTELFDCLVGEKHANIEVASYQRGTMGHRRKAADDHEIQTGISEAMQEPVEVLDHGRGGLAEVRAPFRAPGCAAASVRRASAPDLNQAGPCRNPRGAHAHEDFPERDDVNWMKHSLAWVDENAKVKLGYRPVHTYTLTDEVKYIAPQKRVLADKGPNGDHLDCAGGVLNDAAAARGTFKRNCCTAGFLSAGRSRSSAACDRPAGDASAAPMAAPVAAPILER